MSDMKMFIEVAVDVAYDYQPFEPQTLTGPEVRADIENVCVSIGGAIINDRLDSRTMDSIINQCWIDELERLETEQ